MPIAEKPAEVPPSSANALPVGKTLPEHLQKAMSRLAEIGSLPEITTRIVEVVEDPQATAHHMHGIVKNDPALATKILKVVNSAFYGLPSQIGSLDRAIVMLGLSAVKNIALAASLANMFKGDPISDQFTPRDLWRHCIAVGVRARVLAKRTRAGLADEFFVAGLVHDMGLLVIGQLFPGKLREITRRCSMQPQAFCPVEQGILGADHQAFGAALSTKWKFPPALRHAASYHHDPESLQPEFRRLTGLIYIADTLCGQLKHGYYLTSQTQPLADTTLQPYGLDASSIAELVESLPPQIEEAEAILGST